MDNKSTHLVPISLGELVDKITILELKIDKLQGEALNNVRHERDILIQIFNEIPQSVDESDLKSLRLINATLWDVEDSLRDHERRQDFGDSFVVLARSVYQLNDKRSTIKKQINLKAGSEIIEEKSYQPY